MACVKTSTEAAIVAEINAPASEHWKICGIYLPKADADYVSTN
jgi:hypothetical protein